MRIRRTGRARARRPRRMRDERAGLVVLALAVCASGMLPGCAARVNRDRAEPVARGEAPQSPPPGTGIPVAREQARPSTAEPYGPFRLAEAYVEADSLREAESALAACLNRDPDYAPALALLSRLYYRAGRHAEGAALLEAARSRAATQPGAWPAALLAGLALHYEALGRHDLAAATVAEAARADSAVARPTLVYLTLRGDHPAAAAGPARAAVEDDARSAPAWNNLGITRLRAGDPGAARDAFLRATELDPALPGPYYNLAILERFYRFDDRAAARWLAAYRERAGDDPDGLFRLIAGGGSGPAAGGEP